MKLLRFMSSVAMIGHSLLLLNVAVAADNTAVGALEKADAAIHARASYRMTMTVTDKRGVHITTLEYVRPDHYHAVVDARNMEMILIGKTTYMKSKGQWHKLPGDMSESIAQIRPGLTKEMLQYATVKQSGAEVVNSVPTTIYEVTLNSPGLHSVKRYWISDRDSLLIKMAGTSDLSGTQVLGRTVGGKSTFAAVMDYKANVKIDTPTE